MPDSVPNYLTIDPNTGAVGADFSGHVKAAGVDLNLGTYGQPTSDQMVRWLENGTDLQSYIAASGGPDGYGIKRTHLDLVALANDTDPRYETARLLAARPTGPNTVTNDASVEAGYVQDGSGNPIGPGVYIGAGQGAALKTLLDGSGKSDFLQLGTLTRIRVDFGVANLFFNASAISNATVINHRLNAVPSGVIAMAVAPSFQVVNAVVVNLAASISGTTSFTLGGRTVSGASVGPGNVGVYWCVFTFAA